MLPHLVKCFLYPITSAPKLCRVCFRPDENLQPFDGNLEFAFGADAPLEHMTVQDLLENVAGNQDIKSSIFGGLCEDCIRSLTASFLFTRQCRRADETIRKCFHLLEDIVRKAQAAPSLTAVLAQVSQGESMLPENISVRNYESYENNLHALIFKNEILQRHTKQNGIVYEMQLKKSADDSNDYISKTKQKKTYGKSNKKGHLECLQCGKVFKCLSTMEVHLAYHGEPQYVCECSKRFKSKSDLTRHIRHVHLKERNASYVCNYCGRTLATKYSLLIHIKIHEPKGKYECSICNKIFHREILLRKHRPTHNNHRPEQCDICGNRFVNKKALLYHKRLHTGDKPYQCEICAMRFVSENRKNMHYKNSHTEKTIPCRFCGCMFHTNSQLRGHVKKVHVQVKICKSKTNSYDVVNVGNVRFECSSAPEISEIKKQKKSFDEDLQISEVYLKNASAISTAWRDRVGPANISEGSRCTIEDDNS